MADIYVRWKECNDQAPSMISQGKQKVVVELLIVVVLRSTVVLLGGKQFFLL